AVYLWPEEDGVQLLAEVRRRLHAPQLPATIVTGMSTMVPEIGDAAGPAVQVLAKPFEPSVLVELVRAQLRPASATPNGRRVLLVDDDPLNLELDSMRLTEAGFEVETVLGGTQGLARARAHPPQAILTDVLMPGLDGFMLCREVRSDPRLAGVPVVLVSAGMVGPDDRRLATQAGASDFVERTLDLRGAIEALRRALSDGTPAAPGNDD